MCKLNDTFDNVKIIKLHQITKDICVKSYFHNNQQDLYNILKEIYKTLNNNKNVFVYCQQGKDRSAAIVIAYIMTIYDVTAQQALNYILDKRCIVTVNDVEPLWDFLTNHFVKPNFSEETLLE